MTNLTNVNTNVKTIDSREVAEMLGKAHKTLLRDIEGSKDRKGIIQILRENQMVLSEYFIESSYKTQGNNKTYTCYLVTKMGCEILANKMTGEKGILFTAKYVKRFNKMEEEIKQTQLPQDYLSALKALVASEEEKLKLKPKADNFDKFLSKEGTLNFTETAKAISTRFEEENIDVKISAIKLTKFLRDNGILSKVKTPAKIDADGNIKAGKFKNLPNKDYEDYFNVVCLNDEHGSTQTRVKSSGLEFIYNLLKEQI